ncbi:MAG: alpha/beta hydrolase [Pseudomonadota bacterium]
MSIYRRTDSHRVLSCWCNERLDKWPVNHQRKRIDTRLGETHVLEAGAGRPVVLLPGTNLCAATSLRFAGMLTERFRVLTPDLPGQPGLSAEHRPRGGALAYGQWLTEVLRATNAGEAVIVGHSLGGAIALAGAAAAEREGGMPLAGLVLVDPAGLVKLSVRWSTIVPAILWLFHPGQRSARRLLAMMEASGFEPTSALVEWMELVARHVRTSFAPATVSDAVLARIHIPIEVVSGVQDCFLPPVRLEAGVRRLSSARFTVVEGAGHLLIEEMPEQVIAAIDRILEPLPAVG